MPVITRALIRKRAEHNEGNNVINVITVIIILMMITMNRHDQYIRGNIIASRRA
jgi:hypothetical protein